VSTKPLHHSPILSDTEKKIPLKAHGSRKGQGDHSPTIIPGKTDPTWGGLISSIAN